MQQLWNTSQKECYAVYRSIQKFLFYLAGTKWTLYYSHKPLVPFFTTGMFSQVLDCWVLELQQFNIQFEHISGKKNVVADVISRFRTLGLYQDNGNDDLAKTDNDMLDNVVERFMPLNGYQTWQPTKWKSSPCVYLEKNNGRTLFCTKRLKCREQNGIAALWYTMENG